MSVSGRIISMDPLTDPRWGEFVGRASRAGVWHSSAWLQVIQQTYGYRPAHLAYELGGSLEGILPLVVVQSRWTGKRLVSLPFSGPAGPVGSSCAGVAQLMSAAASLRSALGCKYVSLHSSDDLQANSLEHLAATSPFVCSILPLSGGSERIWASGLKREVRNEVRRAWRVGVSVKLADRPEELKDFYMLYIQTCRRHGMPPQPLKLFEAMWDAFAPQDNLLLIQAFLKDRLITAQVCLAFKDVLSLIYVGTDYRFTNYHPVKCVDWAAIELACARGYRQVDFLQTHVKNAGLRWYKRSFGAVEVPLTYYYYPRVGSTNGIREVLIGGRTPLSRVARGLVRRTPAAALEMIGRLVFKHVG